jgi:nicotinamidase-related amidase
MLSALILIDVINDFDFPEGKQLVRHALQAARRISALKRRARRSGTPIIYLNDNFGRWRSDIGSLVKHCLGHNARGRPVVRLLKPTRNDYFVLKPKHSGFFATALEVLLEYLEVKTLILTGFAGNICVLFTAADAHMRDFKLVVPSDCCASNTPMENEQALRHMRTVLHADVRPSDELNLSSGSRRGRTASEDKS